MSISKLTIATCNVRGIQSKKNRIHKLNTLGREDLDILCIQETRLRSYDIRTIQSQWSKGLSLFSIGEDSADGIAVLCYNNKFKLIPNRELILGRLMFMDGYFGGKKIRIINVYTAQDTVRKIQLFKKLKSLFCIGFNRYRLWRF